MMQLLMAKRVKPLKRQWQPNDPRYKHTDADVLKAIKKHERTARIGITLKRLARVLEVERRGLRIRIRRFEQDGLIVSLPDEGFALTESGKKALDSK
jgi:Mn-dependent DtxR family transcriptional regulator